MLAFAEGQLIASAEMEDIPEVEARQTVIKMDSQARHVRRTVTPEAPTIQQVTCVGERLRPSVGREKVQATCKPFFELRLQPVIDAVSLRRRITATSAEIRIRIQGSLVGIVVSDHRNSITSREGLQVTCLGRDVSDLGSQRRRDLVFHREIATHRVGSLVEELDSPQSQSAGVHQKGTQWSAGESRFKCCQAVHWICADSPAR